jgi:hypothetical protein
LKKDIRIISFCIKFAEKGETIMDESVAFIFKTLIKVPCIIFVSFFIFNIFAFCFIYFKILGLSYVLMQEVVANNYITSSQYDQIWKSSLTDLNDTALVSSVGIIVGKDNSGNLVYSTSSSAASHTNYIYRVSDSGKTTLGTNSDAKTCVGTKYQYGKVRTVGIYCKYTIIWPVSYNKSKGLTSGVNGLKGNSEYGSTMTTTYSNSGDVYDDNMSLANGDILDNGHKVTIPIYIYYQVPGLKYYSDLT